MGEANSEEMIVIEDVPNNILNIEGIIVISIFNAETDCIYILLEKMLKKQRK